MCKFKINEIQMSKNKEKNLIFLKSNNNNNNKFSIILAISPMFSKKEKQCKYNN